MIELTIINNNESSLCATCQGQCCKRAAGIYHPEQVIDIFNNPDFKEWGKTYQIDWWEGETSIYWVRPVHTNSIGKKHDASWGGQCVNLTETGCKLTFEERPIQCQALEVQKDFNCNKGLSKADMRDLWKSYQYLFNDD